MKSVASSLIAAGVLCMVIAVQALPIGPKTLPQIRTNGRSLAISDSKDEAYDYADAFINSLGWAQVALSKIPQFDPEPTDSLDSLMTKTTEFMLGLKLAIEDLKKAGAEINKFKQSRSQGVKVSADAASIAYSALGQLYGQFVTDIQQSLDMKTNEPPGTQMNRRTDLMVKIDNAWQLIDQASIATTYAIIQMPTNKDEKLSILDLTKEQRERLSERLLKQFGETIKNLNGGEDSVTVAAGLLYKVLANEQWKTKQ